MKRLLLHCILYCLVPIGTFAQNNIDSYIINQMTNNHIPGFACSILKDGKLAFEGYYGYAKISNQTPVAPNSSFMLASVSKTVTATALLQLYEQGLFALDDPINNYLPFVVNHPDYPNTPITFRHLLTHTSGIKDNWNILTNSYVIGDSPIALADFLEDYLTPAGDYYNANANFTNFAPQTHYAYSNVGATLCGYLVEVISNMPFNEYCNQHIFEPLCMNYTAWFLSELDASKVVHPYTWTGTNYTDNGLYGYPDYPDGQLRTTLRALSRFLQMYLNQGSYQGQQILLPNTISQVLTTQYPSLDNTQGLIWYRLGGNWWGHNGGDDGVSTQIGFNPTTQTGVVVLSNSDTDITDIFTQLAIIADTISTTNKPICCNYPPPNITGNATTCSSSNQTYTVTPIEGSTYNWTVVGGTILSGQNTNAVEVQWNSPSVGSLNVEQSTP